MIPNHYTPRETKQECHWHYEQIFVYNPRQTATNILVSSSSLTRPLLEPRHCRKMDEKGVWPQCVDTNSPVTGAEAAVNASNYRPIPHAYFHSKSSYGPFNLISCI